MPKPIPLLGGAYQNPSLIANAQRCVNLFVEHNQKDSPFPTTHYPTPGLTTLATAQNLSRWRCLYTASTGDLYGIADSQVFFIDAGWNITKLGDLVTQGTNPCSMQDNGQSLFIVDGSPQGYIVDLQTRIMTQINDSTGSFTGADRVDTIDTFLVFNQPGTQNFGSTLSNTVQFNPLYFAAKTDYPDLLQTVLVVYRQVWLIGAKTTEIWYNAGNTIFPFAEIPGVLIEHGTCAKYSVASEDVNVYFLSQDRHGQAVVLQGRGYQAEKISTTALDREIQSYIKQPGTTKGIDDAIGFCYQLQGHSFYVLTFPTADKTWVYDRTTKEWHQWAWMDVNGQLHRVRANCFALAYGTMVVGDYLNGKLYQLSLDALTDDGQPIPRIRSWPHLVENGLLVVYDQFLASMQVGEGTLAIDANYIVTEGPFTTAQSPFSADFSPEFTGVSVTVPGAVPFALEGGGGILTEQQPSVPSGNTPGPEPFVNLRYSNDGGKTFSNYLAQTLGKQGKTRVRPQWRRLGRAADRVFELSWHFPVKTAINGSWITARPTRV